MVECLTRDREAAGSSLTGVAALRSLARHIYHSLVLVQPRMTRPYLTERLLMGRKESNQTNKQCLFYAEGLDHLIIPPANFVCGGYTPRILCLWWDILFLYPLQTLFVVVIPPANFVCGGVYCFHVVRASVPTSVRP